MIAKTASGIIGIMCLFNNKKGLFNNLDIDKKDYHSIAYISVTPEYRHQGIATKMFDLALKFSDQQEKIIFRTEPTKIGEAYIANSFTDFAQKHYPNVNFVEPAFESVTLRIVDILNKKEVCSSDMMKFVSESLSLLREEAKKNEKFNPFCRFNYISSDEILNEINHKINKLVVNDDKNLVKMNSK